MREGLDFAKSEKMKNNDKEFLKLTKQIFKYVRHLYFLDERLPFQSNNGNHVKARFEWYGTWDLT